MSADLQARIKELEDRLVEQVDRAAHSRDSVVRMRERLREVRQTAFTQREQLTKLGQEHEIYKATVRAFQDGLRQASATFFDIVLERLIERSEFVGELHAEVSRIEARVGTVEERVGLGVREDAPGKGHAE